MASTINENEDFAGGQFFPFQDTDAPRVQKAVQNFVSATQGYDTTVFDVYRQGVSIRTSKHLYSTTQPKIWAGNLNHAVRIVTIGQARDFTEFENSPKFEELPEFNPQWYIEDQTYPFPIVFNNGPQQEEEAIIEPFSIPFRKADSFGNFVPRTPKANLEDGNNFENYDGGSTRVQQFIEYNQPRTPRFFLDEGVEYFGPVTNAVMIEGYVAFIQRDADPFDDTRDERIVEQISTSDATFISRLKELDFDLSEDIRGTFDKKSATAGGDVYGPDSARYGTDSIAYRGLIRGA